MPALRAVRFLRNQVLGTGQPTLLQVPMPIDGSKHRPGRRCPPVPTGTRSASRTMRRTRLNRSGSPVVFSALDARMYSRTWAWSTKGSLSGMVVTVAVGVIVMVCVVVVVVGSDGGGAGGVGCRAGAAAYTAAAGGVVVVVSVLVVVGGCGGTHIVRRRTRRPRQARAGRVEVSRKCTGFIVEIRNTPP